MGERVDTSEFEPSVLPTPAGSRYRAAVTRYGVINITEAVSKGITVVAAVFTATALLGSFLTTVESLPGSTNDLGLIDA